MQKARLLLIRCIHGQILFSLPTLHLPVARSAHTHHYTKYVPSSMGKIKNNRNALSSQRQLVSKASPHGTQIKLHPTIDLYKIKVIKIFN